MAEEGGRGASWGGTWLPSGAGAAEQLPPHTVASAASEEQILSNRTSHEFTRYLAYFSLH